MGNKICIGAIFRKFDESANHFKYHIIIGDKSGELAAVYINTVARYNKLPSALQATQLPLSKNELEFLDHDSFVDCSTVKEFNKGEINEYLQKNTGHHCGNLPGNILENIMRILKTSKTLEKMIKDKYALNQG